MCTVVNLQRFKTNHVSVYPNSAPSVFFLDFEKIATTSCFQCGRIMEIPLNMC